jgi:hypothetical protein
MLDVHAPDHNLHGLRDFMMHIMTITIGLLIALGLEASVEAMHHRHLKKEAETNIRQELRDNRDQLKSDAPGALKELQDMTQIASFLATRSRDQPATLTGVSMRFHEGPIQDAAWRTASSTGVLSYMDYAEVEKFSSAYKEQAMLQAAEEQALEDYLLLGPTLHGSESTADAAKEALPYARRAQAHLSGMLDIGAGTLDAYNDALK